MMLLKKISLLIIVIFLSSCAPKPVITTLEQDTIAKVKAANSDVCAYKGRVLIGYHKDNIDLSFKGMLDKECSGNFHLVVMGPFNLIALDITYKDGEVQAKKNDEDISGFMSYFFKAKHADTIVKLIRYPYINVDDTYAMSTDGKEYIFTKGTTEIRAGQDFLITKIKTDVRTFTYEYQDGKMYNMTFQNPYEKVIIGLR